MCCKNNSAKFEIQAKGSSISLLFPLHWLSKMFFKDLKSVGLNQIITSLRKYLEGKTRERVNVRVLYSLVCKSVCISECVCEREKESAKVRGFCASLYECVK